jgi:putative intracellular protease/amidase
MRILIVVARRYNGHELRTILGALNSKGHKYSIVSTDHIIEDEVTHEPLKLRYKVGDINPDHDALVIVSGYMPDTEAYWVDPTVLKYVETFNEEEKVIAAICGAVPTIRFAAEGKRVSFFPLIRSRQLLQDAGAILMPTTLTIDANLVTAEHTMASQVWAEEVCNRLEGKPPIHRFEPSGFVPKGRTPRRTPKALARILEYGC